MVYILTPDTDSVLRTWQDASASDLSTGRSTCELLLLVTWVALARTGHSSARVTVSGVGMVHVFHFYMEDDTEESRGISRYWRVGGSTSTISLAFAPFLAVPTR